MAEQPSVVVALAAVMEEVRSVRKTDRNSQQNYAFRGIDAVVNAVGPALRKHGVVVVPMLESVNYRDVQTSTGKASRECTVTVRYRFHGPAGDHLDCVTPGESMDFGDKGAPKAMSVAYRIALLQALCLPTDDADPDHAAYERGSPQAPAQRQQSTNGEAKPPTKAELEKRAASAVKTMLAAGTVDDAEKMVSRAFNSPAKDIRVDGLLTADQRETLGLTDEPHTLHDMAVLVLGYVEKHGKAVALAAVGS